MSDLSNNKTAFLSVLKNVDVAFKSMVALLDLNSLPEAPKQPVASQSATVSQPSAPTLRPALIAILQAKMHQKKFRARDMVDYAAAACGIELRWDVANDEVVWCCSEQEAQKIINSLTEDTIPFG